MDTNNKVHALDKKNHNNSEQSNVKKPAKGFFILPNLFTSAGLFAGFYAIMQSRIGNYEAACLAIYVAMVMDMLDGRLARLTNTMSDFGSEYDSLADMVSFGVAPALLMYEFILHEVGRVGGLIAFLYIACAALRLARFNVSSHLDNRYFIGVPSPGAAALLASLIWVTLDSQWDISYLVTLYTFVVIVIAFSMVSNIKYRTFKDVDFRNKMPFFGLILLIVLIGIIYFDPPKAFLTIGLVYLIGGSVSYLLKKEGSA